MGKTLQKKGFDIWMNPYDSIKQISIIINHIMFVIINHIMFVIINHIMFVIINHIMFVYLVSVVCRGPSLLQRYYYTEDRFTNLLASIIRTRKEQQQQKEEL